MENENDEENISKPQEEVTPEVTPETPEEEVDWKAKAEEEKQSRLKAEEVAENQKIRAEKAEKKAKDVRIEAKADLSSRDTIAIINARVHEDDVDEVLDYAKYKKISIAEALKSSFIKTSLAEKEELRNTAEATNTGRTRSGNSKQSGDALLSKAKKTGELPDREEDLDTMLESRYTKKK